MLFPPPSALRTQYRRRPELYAAYLELPARDQDLIDCHVRRLMSINNLGAASALELLYKIGLWFTTEEGRMYLRDRLRERIA